MSRLQYKHLCVINGIKRDEPNYKRPNDYGFSDTEFIGMSHKHRSRIIAKLKFLGYYSEADRLKELSKIKTQN
jgi:hypothetical protein